MSSSNDEFINSTPPEVSEAAKKATLSLLPEKSTDRYLQAYQNFFLWKTSKDANSFSESTIPLIKAVSLKIDGVINLGENYSYDYRVLRSGAKHSHHQNDKTAERQRNEEQLRMIEGRLRKEAAEHRKQVHQKDVAYTVKNHKRQKDESSDNSAIHNTEHVEKHKTKASSSSESSSSDSDSAKQKPATVMIYDETTKRTKKILRFITEGRDYSEPQESSDTRDSSESSASWTDKTRHATTDDDTTSSSLDSNINIINHYVNPRAPRGLSIKPLKSFNKTIESFISMINRTLPTSTQVTTVRTENIYTDPHKVKNDAKITEFTNHLYKQTLKVFDAVKQKTNQDFLKVQVDRFARSYEDKFKEFLRDTSSQKIKTRLGTQKVILNTIDMSNRILKRLMNFMIGDLDNKGILRHNAASANIFQKAIETQQKLQLIHACKKFGICRSRPGFSAFLTDILATLLKCDDKKFKRSIDAFTEVVKNMNFYNELNPHTEKKIKKLSDKIEMQDILTLRAIVLILKNTITNQNKPIIVNNFSARQGIVNSTLALLEIIDLLDTKIPRNESNSLEWTDMKNSFEEFAADKRHDILEIMTAMLKHVKANLKSLDEETRRIVSKILDMILSFEPS